MSEDVDRNEFPSFVKWEGGADTASIDAWLRIESKDTNIKRRINCLNAF